MAHARPCPELPGVPSNDNDLVLLATDSAHLASDLVLLAVSAVSVLRQAAYDERRTCPLSPCQRFSVPVITVLAA